MIWKYFLRPPLFALPAETAHYLSMGLYARCGYPLRPLLRRWLTVDDRRLAQTVLGLPFKNPIGLAAGFDKNGLWYRSLGDLGFGHVEIGTITGREQPGNPRPRLFRLPADQALINRLGFNNQGADRVARRLAQESSVRSGNILGINLGKTKLVELDRAIEDYCFSFERLFAYGDYFTINVSSPNTPGLRELQNRKELLELLGSLVELNQRLGEEHQIPARPILLKIAPDLTDQQLDEISGIVAEIGIQGVIATNTTLSRTRLRTAAARVESIGAGGLSGRPLTEVSRGIVARLYRKLPREIPIVGVEGVMSGPDAWEMITTGASLVQVYTGFIYGGPTFVRQLNLYLLEQLERLQLTSIDQAIGLANDR
jgi:dihydroorotate dehydrogenase